MDYIVVAQALWIVIPICMTNASAVLVGGGIPIDFGKIWRDNRRILGDGKTWRGLFSGTFLGMTLGFGLVIAARFLQQTDYSFLNLTDFEGFPLMIPLLFSLCFGALLGDIIESFFKRRIGKDRGQDWRVFDQLDFIVGALFFCFLMSTMLEASGVTDYNWFLQHLFPWQTVVLLLVTPFIHILGNVLFGHKKQQQAKT